MFFTDLGNDFACSNSNIPTVGKTYLLNDNTEHPRELAFYTLAVSDDTPMKAQTFGHWDHHEYCHDSDTFEAQCGSPYVTNGRVYAFHTSTDQHKNYGTSINPVDFQNAPSGGK